MLVCIVLRIKCKYIQYKTIHYRKIIRKIIRKINIDFLQLQKHNNYAIRKILEHAHAIFILLTTCLRAISHRLLLLFRNLKKNMYFITNIITNV